MKVGKNPTLPSSSVEWSELSFEDFFLQRNRLDLHQVEVQVKFRPDLRIDLIWVSFKLGSCLSLIAIIQPANS